MSDNAQILKLARPSIWCLEQCVEFQNRFGPDGERHFDTFIKSVHEECTLENGEEEYIIKARIVDTQTYENMNRMRFLCSGVSKSTAGGQQHADAWGEAFSTVLSLAQKAPQVDVETILCQPALKKARASCGMAHTMLRLYGKSLGVIQH